MKKILKYKFNPVSTTARHMTYEVNCIRHIGIDPADGTTIAYWAEVDTESEIVGITVQLFGTGEEIPEGLWYRGTIIQNGYVFHMYELPE